MGSSGHRGEPASQQRIVRELGAAAFAERPPGRDEWSIGARCPGCAAARYPVQHGAEMVLIGDGGNRSALAFPDLRGGHLGDGEAEDLAGAYKLPLQWHGASAYARPQMASTIAKRS